MVRPYWGLLAAGLATTTLASVLDGFVLVILIPLLKHLFGTAGALRTGSTQLEAWVDRLVDPLVAGLSSGAAAARLVVVLALGLLVKNALSYASTQITVRAQEGLVRDLRVRLFDHLLTLDFAFFQRTRAGQLISALITEVDQTKTVITAAAGLAVSEPGRGRRDALAAEPDFLPPYALHPRLRPAPGAAAPAADSPAPPARPGPDERARGDHRDRHRADRRHPADPLLRRGSARGGGVRAPGERLPSPGDPDPAVQLADQPDDRGFLRLPGDPHHVGGDPSRAPGAGRARSRPRRSSCSSWRRSGSRRRSRRSRGTPR